MVYFILRKWKYFETKFRIYQYGFKNWKDKMRTHFKNRRGRMGLDIPEERPKEKYMVKEKEALQVMV